MEIKGIGTLSRRGVALAAAVLALGLGVGSVAAGGLALAGQDATAATLALRTASVHSALDTTFQRYADTMHDLVAAATVPTATLAATVDRIADKRLPGAHQVMIVSPARAVLAQQAVDGSHPYPLDTLAPAPELARAMELSRISGRTVASPAHVLPADADLPPAHRQASFELAAPVRDTAFRGWVIVSVRGGDLLDTSLRAAGVTGISAVLAELTPDGATREVARWPFALSTHPDTLNSDPPALSTKGNQPADVVDVALAGHALQVQVRPTTPVIDGRDATPPLVLLGALLIGVLLAGVVLALDAARLRALDRTRRATADVRAAVDRAHRSEQELREREAELSGFASAAAEKLHAPLHTIAGFTDLLLEDATPGLDPASRGFLERIGRSTRRMLGVVDELLAYTAAGDAALKPEPVDTERLALDAAAARLDSTDGERPSIDVGHLPLVTADALLLREVLDQLIGNAVRFVRHDTAARVTVGATEMPGGWWRIEVADRGIGVPEEHRDRIFAPFHRTPAAEGYPGTGLGLAVCRRIVELHGGEIGVEANPGGGSVFWFTVSATGVTLSADDLGALAGT